MGEHRSRIGAALLASTPVFLAAGATIAATSAAGWKSPYVIGVFVAAVLCLLGSLWAFGVWGALLRRRNPSPRCVKPSQVPPDQRSPRGRLEAHAERGKEILARIDKASEGYAVPFGGLLAQAKAMESEERQATALRSDRDGWMATAMGIVERLAPNLLDEYKTDYVVRTPTVPALGAVFHDLREPLRQRLDGLQRVIDAMEDQ